MFFINKINEMYDMNTIIVAGEPIDKNSMTKEISHWTRIQANSSGRLDTRTTMYIVYNIIEKYFPLMAFNDQIWGKFIMTAYAKTKEFLKKLQAELLHPHCDESLTALLENQMKRVFKLISDMMINKYHIRTMTPKTLEFIKDIMEDMNKNLTNCSKPEPTPMPVLVPSKPIKLFVKEVDNNDDTKSCDSDCPDYEYEPEPNNSRPRRNVKKVDYRGMCK